MGGGGEKHGKGPRVKLTRFLKRRSFTPHGNFGNSFRLECRKWRINLEKSTRQGLWKTPHAYWGVSNSPLVLDNQLINLFGNDGGQGALISLDRNTGKTNWIIPCGGTCYSSPTYGILNGLKQVVVLHRESLIGVDYKSGEKLWEFHFTKHITKTPPLQSCLKKKVFFGGENRAVFIVSNQNLKIKNGQ